MLSSAVSRCACLTDNIEISQQTNAIIRACTNAKGIYNKSEKVTMAKRKKKETDIAHLLLDHLNSSCCNV